MRNLRRKLPSGNALFVFEAAARLGNFTRAAEELYVSQPAVSRMLARMEDHLGAQLFERTRNGIFLTESGQLLYKKITEGFDGIQEAILEIERRVTGAETVTLSISTAFTTHWLMPRMRRLNETFPTLDIRFQLDTGKLSGPLVDADLGMRFLDTNVSDDDKLLVMPEIILPVCDKRYRDGLPEEARVIHDTAIVMDDSELSWYREFDAFAKGRRKIANVLRFYDYAVVLQATLLGQGIAVGWLYVVSHWLNSNALVPVEEQAVETGRYLYLQWPYNRPLRPIVEQLRDWIVSEIRSDLKKVDVDYPGLGLKKIVSD